MKYRILERESHGITTFFPQKIYSSDGEARPTFFYTYEPSDKKWWEFWKCDTTQEVVCFLTYEEAYKHIDEYTSTLRKLDIIHEYPEACEVTYMGEKR